MLSLLLFLKDVLSPQIFILQVKEWALLHFDDFTLWKTYLSHDLCFISVIILIIKWFVIFPIQKEFSKIRKVDKSVVFTVKYPEGITPQESFCNTARIIFQWTHSWRNLSPAQSKYILWRKINLSERRLNNFIKLRIYFKKLIPYYSPLIIISPNSWFCFFYLCTYICNLLHVECVPSIRMFWKVSGIECLRHFNSS